MATFEFIRAAVNDGNYDLTVCRKPSWLERAFAGQRDEEQVWRTTVVGQYVWRRVPNGERAEIFFEGQLQDWLEAAKFRGEVK